MLANVPAVHGLQDADPGAVAAVPMEQDVHAVALEELEKLPGRHAVHAKALLKELYDPELQSTQPARPFVVEEVPAGHGSHPDLAALLRWPKLQVVQTKAPCAEYVFSSQFLHSLGSVDMYLPASQVSHW